MKRMEVKAIILAVIITIIFITSGFYFIKNLFRAEEEPEEVIVYLTEEELMQRPLLVEPETAAVVEPNENEDIFIYYEEVPLEKKLQIHTQALCKEYSVSYSFFLAMCESESSFNKDAIGDSGKSVGYMQINRPNWERYDLDAFMVYDNLEIGIRMLSELIEKYSEVDDVVMAYKAGENALISLKASGIRLNACDAVLERAAYWEEVINK